MGLWGLFTAIVGVGAIAKQSIEEEVENTNRYYNAKAKGDPIYYGMYGKTFSSRTGKQCYLKEDPVTRHQWVIDLRTKQRIEDYTAYQNSVKTERNRNEAHSRGEKFYRTAEFDRQPLWWSDVYVNDDMPGRYFDRYGDHFIEGELRNVSTLETNQRKRVSVPNYKIEYGRDGKIIKKG